MIAGSIFINKQFGIRSVVLVELRSGDSQKGQGTTQIDSGTWIHLNIL